MSFFENNKFNPAETPTSIFPVLPEGDATLTILKIEEKTKKDNPKSVYAIVQMQIESGKHKGARSSMFITLQNESEMAQLMGRAQLSALCLACGIADPTNWHEFANKRIVAFATVRPDQDGGLKNQFENIRAESTPVASTAENSAVNSATAENEAPPFGNPE